MSGVKVGGCVGVWVCGWIYSATAAQYFIMSGKVSKWKEVNKTSERLNKMLSSKPNELPTKFAPKRDRSESVDKLFNNSRSRVHSSFEMTALNKTRQQQFLDPKRTAHRTERKEELERKTSAVLPNLNLNERQSTQIFEPSQCLPNKSALLLAEVKKEYLTFKKNVLAELDRQRDMLQKMLKEILLTFEYELEKINRLESTTKLENTVIQTKGQTNEVPKVRSLEQWKASLAAVSIADPPAHKMPELKQQMTLKREHSRPSKEKKDELQPPKLPINLDCFLGNLASLKKQLDQMDRILEKPEQAMLHKTVKK